MTRSSSLTSRGIRTPCCPWAERSASISGDTVTLSSNVAERHGGDSLNYRFRGKVSGDTLSGDLDLGEYRTATWTARRPRTTG